MDINVFNYQNSLHKTSRWTLGSFNEPRKKIYASEINEIVGHN